MSTITDIKEMRGEVLRLNADLRMMSHFAGQGSVSLRDFLVLARLLFGSNPQMARILADIQLLIAILGTARVMLKAFQLELGPYGWLLLAGTTGAGIVASDFAMEYAGH